MLSSQLRTRKYLHHIFRLLRRKISFPRPGAAWIRGATLWFPQSDDISRFTSVQVSWSWLVTISLNFLLVSLFSFYIAMYRGVDNIPLALTVILSLVMPFIYQKKNSGRHSSAGERTMVNTLYSTSQPSLTTCPGPLYYINILGKPVIIVNSFDVANDLMNKRSAMFSDRPFRLMGYLSGPLYS